MANELSIAGRLTTTAAAIFSAVLTLIVGAFVTGGVYKNISDNIIANTRELAAFKEIAYKNQTAVAALTAEGFHVNELLKYRDQRMDQIETGTASQLAQVNGRLDRMAEMIVRPGGSKMAMIDAGILAPIPAESPESLDLQGCTPSKSDNLKYDSAQALIDVKLEIIDTRSKIDTMIKAEEAKIATTADIHERWALEIKYEKLKSLQTQLQRQIATGIK